MRMPSVPILLACVPLSTFSMMDRPYLTAAREVARWIRVSAVQTKEGLAWPSDPCDAKSVSTDLYSGTAGIVLFFLELFHSTRDQAYLADARAGADYLLAKLAGERWTGLYVGLAGVGFTLEETFRVTHDAKYREGARRCVEILKERVKKKRSGVEWSDTTDIVSGTAGTGLFLLSASRDLGDRSARELAVLAGRRLIELGHPTEKGMRWEMQPGFPSLMPNFSHGTAGVAYFLASLYAQTKEKDFLDAAIAGARDLQSIADTTGDVCLIFHHEPDGKDLYYLGWCHGPVGTARLFYRLYQVTGQESWMDWVRKCARADTTSGIPERQTSGFWNNVSQCCGSAGVAEFMLSLHRITGESEYLEFARRMTADLLDRATFERDGMKWSQAEFRIRPEFLVAQTGYMQGAAGVGMWFLHLDAFEQGGKAQIVLPDSPF